MEKLIETILRFFESGKDEQFLLILAAALGNFRQNANFTRKALVT
jgi:hypothetical protein